MVNGLNVGLDAGNVLFQAERIKGARAENQANLLAQQAGAQFRPLLQNFLANPQDPQARNDLIQANPELAQEAFQAQTAGLGVQEAQTGLDQETAQRRVAQFDAVLRSARPKRRLELMFQPEEIQEFEQSAGEKISDWDEAETIQRVTLARDGALTRTGSEFAASRLSQDLAAAREERDVATEERAGRKERRDIIKSQVEAKREETKARREAAKEARAIAKAEGVVEKDAARRRGAISELKSTRATLGRLASHPGLDAATGKSSIIPAIPGSQKANFEALIETVNARLGFAELAKMRAASPSGGALGQISERELSFLQAANQSLALSQSEEQFLENVQLIDESLQRLMDAQEAALAGQNTDIEGPQDNALPEAPLDIPQGAIDRLRGNPALADDFDEQFGDGAAGRVLGG